MDDLHFAASDGDLTRVARLVAEGHDVNRFDDLGYTALHYAVRKEHLDVAQFLLDHGANVDAHHEPTIGNTPLCDVADRCSLRMARLLVDAGADPAAPGWMGMSAIDKAAARRRGEGPQVYQLLARAAAKRTSSGRR